MFGLELQDESDREFMETVTGRSVLPSAPVSEAYMIVGRGGGKSRFEARQAVYFACGREYKRAPGESIYVGIFAPDRKQGRVTFRYIVGLMRAVPALSLLIVHETRDSVELSTGVTIEVVTASTAAPRGRAYALAIVDEAAFLPAGDCAGPDVELLRALRPALARVPGSLLAVVSSPYARRGELYRAWRDHYGKDDSEHVLVVQAETRALNPTFPQSEIDRAYADDPASAAAEYGAEFRTDVESFVSREAVDGAVVPGRLELPPMNVVRSYVSFLDFAGGSGTDSATLAIAHEEQRDDERVLVLDAVREVRPPFSPEGVCKDFAELLKRYRLHESTADRYAGDFPKEQMSKYGVRVKPSERTKSDIYKEFLPLLNSGTVELLDLPRLHAQLGGLERRTARGGKDSIDHGPGQHDDLCNAACGALTLAAAPRNESFMFHALTGERITECNDFGDNRFGF